MRPTALITGASGGIGAALAIAFAKRQHHVILVARSEQALHEQALVLAGRYGIEALAIPCDLSKPGAAERLMGELLKQQRRVDVLVNNAGFATYGPFHTEDARQTHDELQLNITALTELTRLLLPDMLTRGTGRILNVASIAAFLPGPLMAVYYATKAYVLSFSVALGEECRGTGVTVSCLCPGPTATGFQARAKMEKSNLFRLSSVMSAEDVAEAGADGCLAGRAIIVPGWKNKILTWSSHWLPRPWLARIVRQIQGEPHA
jgi:hypothetical protein